MGMRDRPLAIAHGSGARLGVAKRLLSRPAILHFHDAAFTEGEHLVKRVEAWLGRIGGIPAALDHHRPTDLNDVRQTHAALR